MIYHLFQWLQAQGIHFPGVNLVRFITFRALVATMTSLIVALWIGPAIIRRLQKKQIGETIRNLGLEGQFAKKGTPTMGGIIVLLSILIPALLFGDLTNVYVILLILTTVWLGLIGLLDDSIKVFKKDKEGLKGKYKVYGQVSLGLIVGIILCFSNKVVIRQHVSANEPGAKPVVVQEAGKTNTFYYKDVKSTTTTIPFVKHNEFKYSWLAPGHGKVKNVMTNIVYIVIVIFIITAVSNGTNLTDGMDGLATGISAIVGTTLGILAYLSGNAIYSNYLSIMYIPNAGEVVVFMAGFIGALIGFLWFNAYPAQVFMGDTGSLAIGGIIGVASLLIRKELLIPIFCGIFFVESLSVIMQTTYFKYTKRKYGTGVRLFRMSPLHHHYQKENPDAIFQYPHQIYPEAKITVRFWIVAILLCAISIITLKIR